MISMKMADLSTDHGLRKCDVLQIYFLNAKIGIIYLISYVAITTNRCKDDHCLP